MKYNKIDVAEQQLEDLVRRYAGEIEEGLRFVDHQRHTESGRLDVIMVDSGGALVIAELKVTEDDGMLLQAIDYYDHVVTQVERYARLYKDHQIDPSQDVRLFLIAPSFSIPLLTRCKWIEISISLFTYTCIKLDSDKEIIPVFSELAIPSQPVMVEAHSIDDHLKYVTDESTRGQIRKLLDEVRAWKSGHITIEAIKYAISLKVDGHVFAYIGMRRKHFVISTFNPEEKWTDYAVHNPEELSAAKAIMRACFERKSK